jgi:hypothetical protein
MSGDVSGVFSIDKPSGWPLWRPNVMLELMPQVLRRFGRRREMSERPEIRRVVAEVDRDGVAILENAAPPELIATAVRDMDSLVERMPELEGTKRTKRGSTGGTREYRVHEYQQKLKIYRSHDPLMFSPTYAQFLMLPDLMAVTAGYLGRDWLYQAMIATRTEASGPTRGGFAQWHHDARGRKLNVFLLLTDVPAGGPATVVLNGSHRLLYSRARQVRNFFADKEVAAIQRRYGLGPETACHAPAGSLVFFDANALHLGRRSQDRRDAFQVNCMTERDHLWPQEIPKDLLSSLDLADQQHLLHRANLRPV